jgi:hypothetical protein
MTSGEERLKHLEFVQAVIARHANSSFLVRGWALTVIAAYLAIVATRFEPLLAAMALVPLLAFWALDGYFLWQERLFRALYDDVRVSAQQVEPMSMSVGAYVPTTTWFGAAGSKTLVLFYGPLAVLDVVLVVAALVAAD